MRRDFQLGRRVCFFSVVFDGEKTNATEIEHDGGKNKRDANQFEEYFHFLISLLPCLLNEYNILFDFHFPSIILHYLSIKK